MDTSTSSPRLPLGRLLASAAVLAGAGALRAFLHPLVLASSAVAAGAQLNGDALAAAQSAAQVWWAGALLALPGVLAAAALLALWWAPLQAALRRRRGKPAPPLGLWLGAGLGAVLLAGVAVPQPAQAYYAKEDRTEVYFVLPNESAFFVPDAGDNRNSQVAFGSEAYYAANKIASKRFVVPHVKLDNSALLGDYYVPSGRLIIVSRRPYAREWTQAAHRGSSARDESLVCQSAEGIDVTTEVAIASSISEAQAARYLYYFGVEVPEGDRKDPAVIFASVFRARDLASVMDTVVHTKLQSLLCREIGARGLDAVNRDSAVILTTVERDLGKYLADKGITLESLGWAGTFTFQPEVQKAINDSYIAAKVGPVMPVLRQQADIEVKRGLAEGLRKGVPSFLPPAFAEWIGKLFGGADTLPTAKK